MSANQHAAAVQAQVLDKFGSFITRREVKYLPEILAPGEAIHGVCSGTMDRGTWLCVVTDRRVILLDKGLITGLRQLELPIAQIKSVSCKTGLLLGELRIDTGGQTKTLKGIVKDEAPKIAAVLSNLLHQRQLPAAPVEGNDDAVSRLERLAALWEKGFLSDEEFLAQKARILGK